MELLFLAIALAMDSVAISMANGAKCFNIKFGSIIKMSFIFGLAGAVMPTIGYFLGLSFVKFISAIDHYIAFVILLFLGIKMIKESRNVSEECTLNLTLRMLVLGAFATSIDALAVGVTFSFTNADIAFSALVIGVVCFLLCVLGSYIGKMLGDKLESKALILGGIILILIGFKILITHLLD
ncbi:manganese efflux pump [Campylobacter hyointestinalis subsp. hyointestinalis]|nr:manganese efflux pump MntP family protein [Campylobacter hyointestinalis]PPB51998.1 manganese efflux pump [Campylobacter hyointestinalis subsp. hyointestinalis]PPB58120.1 manganese efflux pump [Campylobacter hyointestinalis subsp. hyointestinalis]PPB61483.1 manganese efflux pump [Campylobacter hyointestinalis subsp. hyointestinalis]PPB65496.1 manganese efflux pump [Campylobacter hyointestinalis subsp. hyointestinalis]PPB70843.1 manganese efflux pump [Campylobacter hyointestinalis subsp. hyo